MKPIHLNEFDFCLPKALIAQEPCPHRDQSRLLHYNQATQTITDHTFADIIDLLPKNSVIVLNNTQVINARVLAHRSSGGKIECFFLTKIHTGQWRILIKNGQRIKVGEALLVDSQHQLIIQHKDGKYATVTIQGPLTDIAFLNAHGTVPLPPYISKHSSTNHTDRYQSVFASEPGAVAAPTASLHFTREILGQLSKKKIDIIYITLHIGLGTFNPIVSDNIMDHTMHEETYYISAQAAAKLNNAKQTKRPIIAVGTTAARSLESNIENGHFKEAATQTDLYITPGYSFSAIDGLLTNFHLPKSSLIILVASLIGIDTVKTVYQHAIDQEYRFFSYGDAMLITG